MMSTMTGQPSLGKILVVDDLPQNLRLLASTLTEHGYEVRLAPDGVLALSSAFRFPPDLILLDINMPEMDGYEVCQQLKTSEPTREIPVIFLSAYDEPLDKQKAFEVGGVDYITKPFQVEEALIRIQHHLVIHKLKQQIVEQRNQLQAQNEQLQHEIQERIRAEEEAKEALQIKNKFLTKMSHNLRDPLSKILGFTQILHQNPNLVTEEKNRYLTIIEESGKHLLKLIDDSLDVSQLASGRVVLKKTQFNINQTLQSLNDIFSLKAQQKGLHLIFTIDPDVPLDLYTDEQKLKIILINLLNNAVKFTKLGQIIVSISFDADLNQIRFSVSDTGVGIAPEELQELFQPFVQTSTGIQLGQGAGLGLAISQELTHLLGGEIKVRSAVGKGTTFEFTLPIEAIDNGEIPSCTEERIIGLQPNQPTPKILIVAHSEENRLLLTQFLAPIGFTIQDTNTVKDMIAFCQSWQPHLVLIDLQMPILMGYEAIQQIRNQEQLQLQKNPEQNSTLKMIALTTEPMNMPSQQVGLTGVDRFLYKPFEQGTLLRMIQELLGVQYESEPTPHSVALSPLNQQLNIEKLHLPKLPDQWIEQMNQALTYADFCTLEKLIFAIQDEHSTLARILFSYLENFEYQQMFILLKKL